MPAAQGDGFVGTLRCFVQPTGHWRPVPTADDGPQLETLGEKKLLIGHVLREGSRSGRVGHLPLLLSIPYLAQQI